MKILLGREGEQDHDWYGHWHLELRGSGDETGGGEGPGPEPAPGWVAEVEAVMDECLRWLEALRDSVGSQEDESAVITWLYRADLATRMWDQSRLRGALDELLDWLRQKKERSVPRLLRALWEVIGAQAMAREGDVPDEEPAVDAFLEVSETIADYERWRADQPAASADDVRRAELLVSLLRAVTAEEPAKEAAADRVAELVEMGPEEELSAQAGEIVGLVAAQAPAFVVATARLLVHVVKDFGLVYGASLSLEQQQSLVRWAEVSATALEGDRAEAALGEFISQMRRSLGVTTWLLARGFRNTTGLSLESPEEFDALVTRLRYREDGPDTRDAAEKMYRMLHQRSLTGFRRGDAIPAEGIDLLLVLHALLWPKSEAVVMQLLTRDVDRRTALRVANVVAGYEPPDLIGAAREHADGREWLRRRALSDWIKTELPDVQGMVTRPVRGGMSRPIGPKSRVPALPRRSERNGWHDPMLLAIPTEEREMLGH